MKSPERSKKPVFIVSTGRAGSTMLARVLAIHHEVLALHEPHPHLRTEAFVRWSTPGRAGQIVRKIRKKRKDLIEQTLINHLIYVESSNYASHLIDELYSLFDARFIHLYRDGRDFVRSGLQRDWYRDEPLKSRIKSWIRRRYLVDVGRSALDNLLSPPRSLKTRFEKIAWLWVETNRSILRSFSRLPDDHKLSLSLESLDGDRLAEIHRFIGADVEQGILKEMLSVAAGRPNKTQSFNVPEYADWSDWERKRFDEIAGGMMSRLGYDLKGAGREG